MGYNNVNILVCFSNSDSIRLHCYKEDTQVKRCKTSKCHNNTSEKDRIIYETKDGRNIITMKQALLAGRNWNKKGLIHSIFTLSTYIKRVIN